MSVTEAQLSPPASSSSRTWRHASGLKIVHYEQALSPVVAVQVWVGVGAAQEVEGEYGIAHVHEHMVFKGTNRRGVGQIASDIEAVGGSINAWTSLEETVYHVVMPAEHAALGVDVLLNGVTRPTIDEEELARELEVIREEIRRGDDVPARSHMEKIFAAAWGDHPYARRVIGSVESVSAFDAASLRAFREKWYDLENMRLIVVGACQPNAVDAWVDAALDGARARGAAPRTNAGDWKTRPGRGIVEYREVENARVTIAFPGPSMFHDDAPALDVLTTLLAGMNRSVLYDRLVRDDATAVAAWSDGMYLREGGLVFAGAVFAPDAPLRQILRALGEELSRFTQRLRDEDVRRAIRAFETGEWSSRATVQGLATKMGSGAIHADDPQWQERWVERVRAVRVEDLRRVAKTWLDVRKAVIGVQLPLQMRAQELRASSLQDWLEEGFERPAAAPKARAQADRDGYERMTLANGMTLIAQVDKTLPIFTLAVGTAAGNLQDLPEKAGAHSMMAQLLTSGNTSFDTTALEHELDLLGATFSPASGESTTVLSVNGLTEEQYATLELARACWFESTFPEAEFENARRVRIRGLLQSLEDPGYLAARALKNAFFKEHPYSVPASGTVESVEKLTREDLVDAHRRLLDPQKIVVSVSGDVDLPRLIDQLSAWRAPEGVEPVAARVIPTPEPAQNAEITVEHARKQAVVYVAYPGLERRSDDEATLSTLTSILSGQGGRLFGSLREQRSLAYSVSMQSMSMENAGIVYAAMETSPSKVEEAIAGMREELQRLITEPLTDEEVSRARARIAGSFKVGLQRGSARAMLTLRDELAGGGYRRGLEFPERVASVTAKSVQALAARLIRADREITVVAVPKETPADVPGA